MVKSWFQTINISIMCDQTTSKRISMYLTYNKVICDIIIFISGSYMYTSTWINLQCCTLEDKKTQLLLTNMNIMYISKLTFGVIFLSWLNLSNILISTSSTELNYIWLFQQNFIFRSHVKIKKHKIRMQVIYLFLF